MNRYRLSGAGLWAWLSAAGFAALIGVAEVRQDAVGRTTLGIVWLLLAACAGLMVARVSVRVERDELIIRNYVRLHRLPLGDVTAIRTAIARTPLTGALVAFGQLEVVLEGSGTSYRIVASTGASQARVQEILNAIVRRNRSVVVDVNRAWFPQRAKTG